MTFLSTSGYRLWAAPQPSNLTIASEDLTMKYGAVIDGRWAVIGIIDAIPGESSEPLPINNLMDAVVKAMTLVRETLGRPKDTIGLTPLAIYTPLVGRDRSRCRHNNPDGWGINPRPEVFG
jgi:hypothetical protein